MEEIEISSWLTLDSIKKAADIVETVGSLETGHCMSVFCEIEDDWLELCYSDTTANYLRRYEDREELEVALEKRKEDVGDASFEEAQDLDEDIKEKEEEDEPEERFELEEESSEF